MTLLNVKQLRHSLHISTTVFYKFRRNGMPYHQLDGGRAYYMLDEVIDWLHQAGYRQKMTWTK